MTKIKPDLLGQEIAKILTEYKDEVDELVVNITNEVIKEAKNELTKISPKGETGEYSKGWKVSLSQKGRNFFSKAIWNKTHYRLTHLLEFGHATRNGGHTKPQPHVRSTEEKYKSKFIDEFERKAKR